MRSTHASSQWLRKLRRIVQLHGSMARKSSIFLAALLLAACISTAFCEDDIEDVEDIEEEKAFLVTRKSIADKELVVGKNLTVQIEVHNAGTRCAQ